MSRGFGFGTTLGRINLASAAFLWRNIRRFKVITENFGLDLIKRDALRVYRVGRQQRINFIQVFYEFLYEIVTGEVVSNCFSDDLK